MIRPVQRRITRRAGRGPLTVQGGLMLSRSDRVAYYRNNSLTDSEGSNDIIPISNPTDTSLSAAHTYTLPVGLRAALGSVDSVDHWAYSSAGAPKTVTGAVIKRNGQGMAFFAGDKDMVAYETDRTLTECKKIWSIARIHTILDADTILNENTLLR